MEVNKTIFFTFLCKGSKCYEDLLSSLENYLGNLTIFAKHSILDVLQGSECAYEGGVGRSGTIFLLY